MPKLLANAKCLLDLRKYSPQLFFQKLRANNPNFKLSPFHLYTSERPLIATSLHNPQSTQQILNANRKHRLISKTLKKHRQTQRQMIISSYAVTELINMLLYYIQMTINKLIF